MIRIALVAAILSFVVQSRAETNTVRSLTLKECIQIALEHNLHIKVERLNPVIAQNQLSIAYSAYEPSFSSSATHSFNESPGGVDAQNRAFPGTVTHLDEVGANLGGFLPTGLSYDIGGSSNERRGLGSGGPFQSSDGLASIRLRQPLLRNLWIDANRLEIQASKKILKISEAEFRLQVMKIVTDVEFAYYELKLAQENARVQRLALKLATDLLDANKERVKAGTAAPLDEKQAESQVSSQQADVLLAEQSLSSQQNATKSLLSDNYAEWQDVVINPVDEITASTEKFDRTQSWNTGMSHRPELLQARLELERLGVILKYRRNQLFPQLDLIGSYGLNGAGSEFSDTYGGIRKGDGPFYSYGIALTVPLGNRAARGNYAITKAQKQQALLRLQQLEQNVLIEIEDAVTLAQTMLARVALTREARIFAEQALAANQTMYENGKTTSFFVLQFQRDLTAARLREIQSLADYNRALARLALSQGTVMERHNLNLNIK
ncbi:MAG: Outer rane efflux protein [Verrucomicrobiales bacterium]|nr:Outer rane efflux protein [Verrucomicrobiales bacterium]